MREIRRRTRVVGAFPDGNSALMLVAARLRHISEPPRVCRRLQHLRNWSHEKEESTLEDARVWVGGFVDWYNIEHRHSAIKFVTPAQRHRGEDKQILAGRHVVYKSARALNPSRWSRATRDWSVQGNVELNPEVKKKAA